ncbi:tetratricopeptide repeat protein [Micromonospora sp. NPDC051141]|uniref:tetratricopeptide repeat protein n=1 Tax=Micromonospora sp. NPDC051141 TaxID=3364284 RepID=UPI00379B0BF7
MPTRTPVLAAWTPAFVAEVVAATLEHAAVHGLHHAARDAARSHGLSPATVEEWVSRARAVPAAPVPPDLLACHTCRRSMILIHLPGYDRVYLCTPSCGRTPVSADEIREAVAAVVLHHTPHLVPAGKTSQAASYALGPIQRVTVGATSADLHITWRAVSRQVTGPMMAMAQRLHLAQRHAADNTPERAINVLHSGLLHIDPTNGRLALETATARAAALLAALTLTGGDPAAALPWARWGHRSLRHLLRDPTNPDVRAALRVLAATHRAAGNLTAAADCYSDLIRHHTQADGPYALPTLAAQATLAVVLHEHGRQEPARQLLARTISDHRRAHPHHPGIARMTAALHRMHTTATGPPGHPTRSATSAPPDPSQTTRT